MPEAIPEQRVEELPPELIQKDEAGSSLIALSLPWVLRIPELRSIRGPFCFYWRSPGHWNRIRPVNTAGIALGPFGCCLAAFVRPALDAASGSSPSVWRDASSCISSRMA